MSAAAAFVPALLAAGLLPFLLVLLRGKRLPIKAGILVGWAIASMTLAWATTWMPAEPGFPTEGRPLQVVEGGFTSSDACQSCHPSEHASWHASYHRTMTQLATADVVRGNFDNVVIDVDERSYLLERKGDEFFVNGRRVLMTTGSHHMQVYWVSEGIGRLLSLVELVYLFDEERWIPRRDAFLQPPDLPQRFDQWNSNCIECHSTYGRPRIEHDVDTRVTELGIACEACHGEGKAHVAANRSPLRRYARHLGSDEADPTVVNPERLSARLASHVCARCHASSAFTPEQAQEYWHGEGDGYRPGKDLNRTSHVLLGPDDPRGPRSDSPERQTYLRETLFWPDGPSRGTGREFNAMLHSACFGTGESPNNVSCLSCHDMHRKEGDPRPIEAWTNDQLQPGMDGDRACLQCHAEDLEPDLTRHTRHEADSSGSRCYNCHMPHTTYGLLKAVRSHFISSPSVANSLETGRPNACNLCHLDRSLGWTSSYLREWYGTPVEQLTAEQRELADSIRWLLTGDARQRVLLAWHAGWEPAQRVSGKEWIAPFLAPLLADPYAAVRIVAGRSMRTLPGYEDLAVDHREAPARLRSATRRVWQSWERQGPHAPNAALLIGPEGMDAQALLGLLSRRDDHPVAIAE